MPWRYEGGGGEGHGVGGGDRWQATMMNAVDGGGATAAAAAGWRWRRWGVFCTVFVAFSWLFQCCFEGKVVSFWR